MIIESGQARYPLPQWVWPSLLVRWELPAFNWYKRNTKRSVLGYPSLASGSGFIRDCHGRWVMGQGFC